MTSRRFHPALLALVLLLTIPRPAAAQWQIDGVPVCTVAGEQTAPAIVRSNGGAIVVWEDARTSPSRIFAQRLSGAGFPMWAAGGVLVATKPGSQTHPVAVSDGGGGVIVAWVQNVSSDDDIYAQRLNASGVRQWAADGVVVCNATGQQSGPAIVSDGTSPIFQLPGAIIAWTDARPGPDTDIYAQAISTDGAARWTANGVGVCVLWWNQSDVVMVTDGSGQTAFGPRGVILAWEDERDSPGFGHIYSQRLNQSGVTQWITNGVGLAPQVPDQQDVRLVYTGAASAIAVWSDGRGANRTYDLYAQRVANNAVSWAPSGVRVCDVDSRKNAVAITSDGAGGALLAWSDLRNFFDPNLYMQRLDPNGARLWGATASVVNDVVAPQSVPVLVAADAGSAVLAWQDRRSGTNDLYAQKVQADSTPAWDPDGVPICRAINHQLNHVAVLDSTFGALVAWVDYRADGADIYANRVGGGGEVVAVETPLGAALRLLPPQPNPSAGAALLHFELPAARAVTVRVFDVNGRLTRVLARGQAFAAGRHAMRWDGLSEQQEPVPAGVYFARLDADGESKTQRIVMLSR